MYFSLVFKQTDPQIRQISLKEHVQQLPWWTEFAEIQPKLAQQIETKTHEV